RADAGRREEPGRGVAEEDRATDGPPPGSGIAQGPEEGILGRTDRLEAGVDARTHLLELRPDLAGEPPRTQRLPRIRTAEEDSDAVLDRIHAEEDRKSTRLNSSHVSISYAVFCLKKKNQQET